MKAVKVEWLDIASGTIHWTDFDDLEFGPLECESVGWLVKETDEYIAIAQNYNKENDLIADTMTFPKSVVVKMTELK